MKRLTLEEIGRIAGVSRSTVSRVVNGHRDVSPAVKERVLAVIAELAASGMTMIIVTHEMGFARQVAHRVVLMEDGVIKHDAPPAQFFGEQAPARLKAFLSTIH